MGLNVSKGNMYSWVTHTWNTIKGECYHDCTYCYMKRWGKQKPVRFDVSELKTNLGSDNFVFVGSSCDMWATTIPNRWIIETIKHCDKFENTYLFQTKNPANIRRILANNSRVCVTIESNRFYPEIMKYSPTPIQRFFHSKLIRHPLYITIEPIMDFDLEPFVDMLKQMEPQQVNIGSDSGGNNLPEPPKEKLLELIDRLKTFTIIDKKTNLKRLLS